MFYHKPLIIEFNKSPIPPGVRLSNAPIKSANDNGRAKAFKEPVEKEEKRKYPKNGFWMKPIILFDILTGAESHYDSVTAAIKDFSGSVTKALIRRSGGPSGRMCRNFWCRYASEPRPTPEEVELAKIWLIKNSFRFRGRIGA